MANDAQKVIYSSFCIWDMDLDFFFVYFSTLLEQPSYRKNGNIFMENGEYIYNWAHLDSIFIEDLNYSCCIRFFSCIIMEIGLHRTESVDHRFWVYLLRKKIYLKFTLDVALDSKLDFLYFYIYIYHVYSLLCVFTTTFS